MIQSAISTSYTNKTARHKIFFIIYFHGYNIMQTSLFVLNSDRGRFLGYDEGKNWVC